MEELNREVVVLYLRQVYTLEAIKYRLRRRMDQIMESTYKYDKSYKPDKPNKNVIAKEVGLRNFWYELEGNTVVMMMAGVIGLVLEIIAYLFDVFYSGNPFKIGKFGMIWGGICILLILSFILVCQIEKATVNKKYNKELKDYEIRMSNYIKEEEVNKKRKQLL